MEMGVGFSTWKGFEESGDGRSIGEERNDAVAVEKSHAVHLLLGQRWIEKLQ